MVESDKSMLGETERFVVISAEDAEAARKFWSHFEIAMPKALEAAFDAFQMTPSVETQDELKLQLCKAVSTCDHEIFRDEIFVDIIPECRNTAYAMSFDRQLEASLTPDSKNKS